MAKHAKGQHLVSEANDLSEIRMWSSHWGWQMQAKKV